MPLTESEARRLAGRLVLGRVPGTELDEAHRQALSQGTLGGITLFRENAENLKQLAKLTGDIIEASHHNPILAVDQEGGAVQRFDRAISPLPSPMALAALAGHPELDNCLETITDISAGQLKQLGINMLLAPTLDLQTNARNPIIGTRACGDDGEKTSAIAGRIIARIEATGLIAVGKHFPGHGSTSEDSHEELALVDKSEAQLQATDLLPFVRLAPKLKAMLVGHIWLPQLIEEKMPATLSEKIVGGLLRQKTDFNGLVVSDDMIMKAITRTWGLGEACVMALLAGVDLLLVCGTMEESLEAVDDLTRAILSGRISEDRLHQAVSRVEAVAGPKPLYLDAESAADLQKFEEQIERDSAVSAKCSAAAIAMLQRGNGQNLASVLAGQKTITVVAPAHPRYPMALAADLRTVLSDQTSILDLRYPVNPGEDDIAQLLPQVEGLVIFATYRSAINGGQANLAGALLGLSGGQLIHVATDAPYDLQYLPGFEKVTSLATFDPSCQAITALSQVLTGAARPEGRCPLKLPARAEGWA